MIITIDGPAGTGKTTVAKKVAEALHYSYFDTGAMYRSVTWALLQKSIPLNDVEQIEAFLNHFQFSIQQGNRYFVGHEEVTEEIRSARVTSQVSIVAALPPVRKALWQMQHQFAEKKAAVFEGRDLGTVVFPDAEVKIFLTGRPEVRAQRRLHEISKTVVAGEELLDPEKMVAELMRRDELDSSRSLAPLKCPEDAYIIDTSDLSINEVVEHILKYKNSKVSL